ncbi:Redoxin [Collybia nuda]|uniref:Redoxin n=1 Tax=Collybia nuda TaxID=64659 RepID=A0A9P6CEI9_9AGAR|nr:Redoxin [Collybia nuda]
MTSTITSVAQAAHSIASSLLATAQIRVGDTIPAHEVKEIEPHKGDPLVLKGKNIILGVPGAFTGTCHAQIPGYIKAYDEFKAKGVNEIFVVAINDVFVTKAWKENLAPEGTNVRFLADDTGKLTSSLGLVFDATPILGGPRSKRYAIVADDGQITSIAIEEDPTKFTVTDAKVILASL